MFDIIMNAIKSAWEWLLGVVASLVSTVLGWILSLLPSGLDGQISGAWSTIAFAIDAANQWAPISEAIAMSVALISFSMSYLGIKILIKMIP